MKNYGKKHEYLLIIATFLFIYIFVISFNFEIFNSPNLPNYNDYIVLQEDIIHLEKEKVKLIEERNELDKNINHYQNQLLLVMNRLEKKEPEQETIPAPQNRIKQENVTLTKENVLIDIKNPQKWYILDTDSMLPVIDYGAILVTKKVDDELSIGDIIFFETKFSNTTLVHRIIKKNMDEQGIYYITKGDNNEHQDPGKTRIEDIKGVVVAIIY